MIILVMLAGKTQATSFIVVTVYCHGDPNPRITIGLHTGGDKKTLLIKTNFLRKMFSFKDLSYYNFFITRFFTHMSFPQDTF